MSWECYSIVRCKRCKTEYQIENSTLCMDLEKCPNCGKRDFDTIEIKSAINMQKK